MPVDAAAPRLADVLEGLKVVDADTHITEPPDLWTSRAPATLKPHVPYVERVDGRDYWYLDGEMFSVNVGGNVVRADGSKEYGVFHVATFDEIDRAASYVGPRLALMDRLGIWAQIVYPNAIGFSSNKFMRIEDRGARDFCITAYNDAMGEFQAESNNRVFPQALLPFWDMTAMTKEMVRAKEELKLTGICLTDRPESFDLPEFGTSHWDPFWQLASDLEMPINFHIGGGEKDPRSNKLSDVSLLSWQTHGPQVRNAIQATQLYMSNVRIIANLVMSDIFDRFPKLKVVSVESGISWIPFVLEALEYQLDEMVTPAQRPQKRRPTEYFRDHIYACFWFESFGPRHMLDVIGVKNVLFETDFPHPTCLYPRSQEHVADVLRDLDPYVRRRVLQDNAIELYHLPIAVGV